MRILVTGGSGFIGSNISIALKSLGHDVVILDNFSSGTYKNLIGFSGEVVQKDLSSISFEDLDEINPDAIIHQGAITDTTCYDEKLMFSVNTNSFYPILDYCESTDSPLVYASSAAVYGALKSPQIEDLAGSPLNVYGYSKFAMDQILFNRKKTNPKLKAVGFRYFNVFGPRESYKGKMASMVFQLYNQIKSGKNPKIFKWGEQSRDFIYVKDIVDANIFALKKLESSSICDVFNLGCGHATSFKQILEYLSLAMKKKFEIDFIDNPYSEKYQNHTQASIEKLKNDLGFTPKWEIKKAIEDYVSYLEKSG